jgi:peptidoglycan/LPS O-acetylase OafA/YrhL
MSKSENSVPPQGYPATAAILVLLTLTGVMLLALFSRSAPHPPIEAPPFALGPFLGASLAIGAAAFHLLRQGARHGGTLAVFFALTALVSFGPQKYLDPEFSRIWPAVITAQIAVITILAWSVVALRRR